MDANDAAKALFSAGVKLLESNDFEGAETLFCRTLELAPRSIPTIINLAVARFQQNKFVQSRNSAQMALAVDVGNIQAYAIIANCFAKEANFEQALQICERIISINPRNADAHCNRGSALDKLNRYEEALSSYDRAILLEPNNAAAHVSRGNALIHLRRYQEALVAYEKALAFKPDLAGAWLGRGNVCYGLKLHDEALAAYDKALALKPDLAEARLGRGNVCHSLKRCDDAGAEYDKAVALKPDLAEAWLGRGNVWHSLKRYDEALAAYDKASTLKPDLAEVWLGRGSIYQSLKRYDEALAGYAEALTSNPDLTDAWFGRGKVLALLGRGDQAVADYRKALELGGDSELIEYSLAALGAAATPAAMPTRMVTELFDDYADNFDEHLVGTLKYQAPSLLVDLITRFTPSRALDIVDLGCGTGLVALQFRPLARNLTGVDVSANMLAKARQRGLYDHLVCSDINQFLQTHDGMFDLAVAADVFIYIGDLSSVFQEVRRVLRDVGLFCFSVETTDHGDFVLRSNLRYAHSVDYLRRLAEQNAFAVETIVSQAIRQDEGGDVNGYYAVMRCL